MSRESRRAARNRRRVDWALRKSVDHSLADEVSLGGIASGQASSSLAAAARADVAVARLQTLATPIQLPLIMQETQRRRTALFAGDMARAAQSVEDDLVSGRWML